MPWKGFGGSTGKLYTDQYGLSTQLQELRSCQALETCFEGQALIRLL